MFKFFLVLSMMTLKNNAVEAASFTSSNLPILLIDTGGRPILDQDRIPAHLEIKHRSDGGRNFPDQPSAFSGRINIEIRGSSSAYFDKKSYGFETQDEDGNNFNIPLLDLPKENDWILYGPYSDKSLLRNAVTFSLTRKMGRYASDFRFCELLINGEYLGLYLLMEKIKRDRNRVNIAELTPDIDDGDALTGGYIIKVDKRDDQPRGWTSPSRPTVGGTRIFFQYVYPNPALITSAQERYVQKFILDFENALNSSNFRDSHKGYLPFVDELSFVDMMIINELTKNIDGYRFSTFMYKDRNGPLTMGPIWDYNLGYGNVDYGSERAMHPDGWMYDQPGGRMYWWRRMMQNYKFKIRLSERWYELRRGPFSTTNVTALIDSLTLLIDEAQARNFQRWPVLGRYLWPNYFVGKTHSDEIDYLKGWIFDRMEWLDDNMPYPDRTVVRQKQDVETVSVRATPNPFTRLLRISMTADDGEAELQIFDVLGKPVLRQKDFSLQRGNRSFLWDGQSAQGSAPPGIYFFRLLMDGKIIYTGKLVKAK